MRKKIFNSSFVYWLAIIYSAILVTIYIFINIKTRYIINGTMHTGNYIDLILNSSILISFVLSFYYLIFKNRISIFFINTGTIIFLLVLMMSCYNYYKSTEPSSYLFASVMSFFITLFIFLTININKIKKIADSSLNDIENIGKSE